MDKIEICISWDAYLNNVSKGFSCLQQNSEFVDMTLAAEGHLVKVHQIIVALASPYLKAMLQSAPCQHPVIFLNNINHKILGYILEYIYTGEVKVPSDIIGKFIDACKSLCIRGVDSLTSPKAPGDQSHPQIKCVKTPPNNNFAAHITINNKDNNCDLQLISNENIVIGQDNEKLLPPPMPDASFSNNSEQMDTDIGTSLHNHENTIDIGSIHDFVIFKPKSSCTNVDQSTNNTENTIKILSDEIIVAKDLETKTNNLTESAVNIALHTKAWHIDSSQSLSGVELSNPVQPVNTTLCDHEWPSEPTCSMSHIQTDSIETVSPETANIISIKRKPKNVTSYIKDTNNVGDGTKIMLNELSKMDMDKLPRYTISTRGSLQMLLCHYLYHSHHHSNGGRKVRWRCIDYRKMQCPSYVDTDDDQITALSINHCHANHDTQIRKKMKNNIVFTSLRTALHTIESPLMDDA